MTPSEKNHQHRGPALAHRGWAPLAFLTALAAWVVLATGPARAASETEGPHNETHPEKTIAAGTEQAVHGGAEKPSSFEHVVDTEHWHFFETFGPRFHLWNIGWFRLTKYMILEVVAALLVMAVYIPLARRLQSGEPSRGGWQNAFETLLTFIREDVAKPNLGEHEADQYLPFLWTLFLFVLFCNLLGMIPFAGSPTANLSVTGALALCTFVAIHAAAVAKMGFVPYLKSLWPHLDIPIPVMGFMVKALICVIEILGVVIKSIVLAVRLFANMFAGHMVLATIMLFIIIASNTVFGLWATVTIGSVLGVVALSLLELFVAFLQAYIFVFLTALFIGMAVHPQH